MIKHKKFLLLCFFIIFMITFIPTKTLAASSSDVSLSQFKIKTNINKDGSIDVEELITYKFDGEFNGAYRDISTEKTDGMENLTISLLGNNGNEVAYKNVSAAKNGDNGVYEVLNQGSDLYRIKIYSPSDDEQKTFKLTYTMKNVAIKYNDIGEFYYVYWSNTNDTEIDNFSIEVNLPDACNAKDIKAFGHGPYDGTFNISNGKVDFFIPHVNSNKLVEARVLFPKELISLSSNIKTEDGLSRILSEEAQYEKIKQDHLALMNTLKIVFNTISILTTVVTLFIMIITTKRFKRKASDTYDIYSPLELPEECTPAVASYFYSRTVTGRAIYATILDLWRRDYLNVEKTETDFKISINKNEDSYLLEHEKHFIYWIIYKLGNAQYVYLSAIKKELRNSLKEYNSWIALIRKETKTRQYFDAKANKTGGWEIFLSVITIILSIISLALSGWFGFMSLFIGIVFLIHGIAYALRKSDYGEALYIKWSKFIKYIKSLNLQNNNSLELDTLEAYIPYAEALGVSEKQMGNLNSPSYTMNYGWIYYYFLFNDSNLKDDMKLNHCVYTAFGTGSSGTTGSFSGGGGAGGAGGGGAGGF